MFHAFILSTVVILFDNTMSIEVLFVDDEPDLLDLGKVFLERSKDIIIDTAPSAIEAQRMMAGKRYDAIISDYHMPSMNGIDFLKIIRGNEDHIPFILFTSKEREEVVIEALNNGADFYVKKGGEPVSQFVDLEHKVKQAVSKYRAEITLKRNEEQFRSFVEGAHAAIILTQKSIVTYANPKALEMFGYSKEDDVVGSSLIEFISPQDRIDIMICRQFLERDGQKPFGIELTGIRGDGSHIPFHIAMSSIGIPGEPGNATLSIITDLTERYKMEKALRQSERKYKAIFNETAIGISTMSYEGRPLEFNDELGDMLGYSKEEMNSLKLSEITYLDDVSMSQEMFAELMDGKVDKYENEVRYYRKDGSIIWAHIFVSLIEANEKQQPLALVLFNDITARKKSEQNMTDSSILLGCQEPIPYRSGLAQR
jgi:PAS domain S-box-containing protein